MNIAGRSLSFLRLMLIRLEFLVVDHFKSFFTWSLIQTVVIMRSYNTKWLSIGPNPIIRMKFYCIARLDLWALCIRNLCFALRAENWAEENILAQEVLQWLIGLKQPVMHHSPLAAHAILFYVYLYYIYINMPFFQAL